MRFTDPMLFRMKHSFLSKVFAFPYLNLAFPQSKILNACTMHSKFCMYLIAACTHALSEKQFNTSLCVSPQ